MDIKKFEASANKKKKELGAFLDKLDVLVPENLTRVVKQVDATVWSEVDCTTCANCCKTMTPTFRKSDVERISAHLGMTSAEFRNKWLLKEEDTKSWVNKLQPCQFLVDNKCSIYEVRPKDCAEFPHHNKKPFDLYNDTFKNNLTRCPATFLLVQRLKKRIETEYEW